jgi:hypothetical protein
LNGHCRDEFFAVLDTTSYIPVTVCVGGQDCNVTLYRAPGRDVRWIATGEYQTKPLDAQGDTPDEAREIWTIFAWLIYEEAQPADCP